MTEHRYSEAETRALALLSAIQTTANVSVTEMAQVSDLAVESLVLNGRGAEPRTQVLALQVLQSREDAAGSTAASLATSLRNLGDVLFESGNYQQASERYQQSLGLHERAPNTNRLDVAKDLDRLARALTWNDRGDDALAVLDRALALKEKELGGHDRRLVETLEIRASLLQRRGEYALARSDLDRAVALQQIAGAKQPAMAAVLSLLGLQFWLEGDLAQSKQFCGAALTVASEALRADHPEVATYLRNLAVPVGELGDLKTARALRERALAIAEQTMGKDHPAVGLFLNDLAISFTQEGDYAAARLLYERALRIYQRRLGDSSTLTPTVIYNLASVNAVLTNFSEARRQFNQAIASWERIFNPQHPNVARGLTALAEMLSAQGLDTDAKAVYQRALIIREQAKVRNQRDIARTLILLAATEAKLGNSAHALELSSQVVRMFDESEPDGRRAADALLRQGSLQVFAGDFRAAQESYLRAWRSFVGCLDRFTSLLLTRSLRSHRSSRKSGGRRRPSRNRSRLKIRLATVFA